MITVTRESDKIYITIDMIFREMEPVYLRPGKIYKLYETTVYGTKYLGKYMVREIYDDLGFHINQLGPLKYDLNNLLYKNYYQAIEPGWDENITRLLVTDNKKFYLDHIMDKNPITKNYKYVRFIDGILAVGNKIIKIDNKIIDYTIEDNALYMRVLEDDYPPKLIEKYKITTLPFIPEKGRIAKIRYADEVSLTIRYPTANVKIWINPTKNEGEITKITYNGKTLFYEGEEQNEAIILLTIIDSTNGETSPEILEVI